MCMNLRISESFEWVSRGLTRNFDRKKNPDEIHRDLYKVTFRITTVR